MRTQIWFGFFFSKYHSMRVRHLKIPKSSSKLKMALIIFSTFSVIESWANIGRFNYLHRLQRNFIPGWSKVMPMTRTICDQWSSEQFEKKTKRSEAKQNHSLMRCSRVVISSFDKRAGTECGRKRGSILFHRIRHIILSFTRIFSKCYDKFS